MGRRAYRQKIVGAAKEFDAIAKRFGSDAWHVKESLGSLMKQKSQIILALQEIEHDVDEHHEIAYRLVGELEKLIKKQERYLSLVKSKYERFKSDAKYLKDYIMTEKDMTPMLSHLSLDYLSTLENVFVTLDTALAHEMVVMIKERRDIRKAKGRKFVQNFTGQFDSYLKDAREEAEVDNALRTISSHQDRLRHIGSRIKMESSSIPLQVSSIVLILDSIASGVMLPAISHGKEMLDDFASR